MEDPIQAKKEYASEPEKGYGKRLEGLGVAQKEVRDFNRRLILAYLREQGPALRAQVADSLGLSRATVTHIVNTLLEEGLVIPEQEPGHTGDKRAGRIQFNVNYGWIIGIDLGRSRLRIYLTNLAAEIIDEHVEPVQAQEILEQGLNLLAERIEGLVQRRLGSWEKIRGIGMGIPGSANRDATRIISPPQYKHWKAIDIPARLKQLLNLDKNFPLHLDNDANLGALGENRYGRGRGLKNMIYIKLSSGIGAGLILNGEVYRGEQGLAGEFGHLRIQFGQGVTAQSPICSACEEQGCLEVIAGLSAIVKKVQRDAPEVFSSPFGEDEIAPVHAAEIIQGAESGKSVCLAALREAGERIGAAIGGCLINVYNPALILLDGGMIRPTKNGRISVNTFLVEQLKKSARLASLGAAWKDDLIDYGQLGDNAVGLGAVAAVIDGDRTLNISTTI